MGRMKRSILADSHDKDCVKSDDGKGGKGGKAEGNGGSWRGSRKGGRMKRSISAGSEDTDYLRSNEGMGAKGAKPIGLAHSTKLPETKSGVGHAKTSTHVAVLSKDSGE